MRNSILYTFHDVYLIVKENIRFVVKLSLGFLLVAIIYTIFTTKYYESYISIYPDQGTDNNIGNFMGVGAVLGLDFGANQPPAFYIPDVINSRRLKSDIVLHKWNSNLFSRKINLIEYWDLIPDSSGFFYSYNPEEIRQISLQNAISQLEDNLYVFEEESGLIQIRVLMEEAQLAADIANYISSFLIQYIGEELKLKSTQYRKFLENRLLEVEKQLEYAESNLTSFRNKNPIAKDTPYLQNLRGQLIRDLEVEQQVFLTLRTQYEIARAEELKEQPVINILDYASVSINPYWPNYILIFILSLFMGFMVSIIILTSSEALLNKR